MPTVKPAELARHWGVGPSYVSNLRARAMPEFESLEAADLWRLEHCPPRARRAAGCAAAAATPATHPEQPGDPAKTYSGINNPPRGRAGPEPIDTSKFLIEGITDFDAWAVKVSEESVMRASGLLAHACDRNDVVAIKGAQQNLNEAMANAAKNRERFMGLQQKAKLLAPIDKILDVVVVQLQEVRLLLTGMGTRIGPDANPSDAALAQRTIDAEIDRVFAQMDTAVEAIKDKAAA